jgi:hypothetical protein
MILDCWFILKRPTDPPTDLCDREMHAHQERNGDQLNGCLKEYAVRTLRDLQFKVRYDTVPHFNRVVLRVCSNPETGTAPIHEWAERRPFFTIQFLSRR